MVDSHTEGEPTRVVIGGWPLPEGATLAERRDALARDQDALRRAVVSEPRGHEAVVGALLTPPASPDADVGVIFFDNGGVLGMCGHGLIGVARTLQHLGRLPGRSLRVDTPVGPVGAELHEDGSVTIENVEARCVRRDLELDVAGLGPVRGDVAWGGNWFFLTELPAPSLDLANAVELLAATTRISRALAAAGIRGDDGSAIDHVELFGSPRRADADSRNFVLCPSLTYDRSPCGTGTSAKLASLHARGRIAPGERWRQESITGSLFTAWLEEKDGRLRPRVTGRAFVTGQATLLLDPRDPFRHGIAPPA